MDQREFKKSILQMLSKCYVDSREECKGFKLHIEHNPIISIANTVEALLIMEQLYGKSFVSNRDLFEFDFNAIKKYLLTEKGKYLKLRDEELCNEKTSKIAYCGIGLLLLNEVESAKEVYIFLENKCSVQKNMWGTYALNSQPDIYATYMVAKLMNRLHIRNRGFNIMFVNMLKNSSDLGIAYNATEKEAYVEALTIGVYMSKFYYNCDISEENIQIINSYFANKTEAICRCIENDFSIHPEARYHVFAFGLAAFVTEIVKCPFYIENGHYILERLHKDFADLPRKSIPFCLELCRMYNAIKKRYDPFKREVMFDEIESLKKQISDVCNSVKSYTNDVEGAFGLAVCIVVVFLYFISVFGLMFWMIKSAISLLNLEGNHKLLTISFRFLEILISVITPVLFCFWKNTRHILIRLVNFIIKHVQGGTDGK